MHKHFKSNFSQVRLLGTIFLRTRVHFSTKDITCGVLSALLSSVKGPPGHAMQIWNLCTVHFLNFYSILTFPKAH